MKITIDAVRQAFSRKGYRFFDGNKPYNLNLVGVRRKNGKINAFDDVFLVIYRNNELEWKIKIYSCTTEPGKDWLNKPGVAEGTAVLLPGQHGGLWKVGLHKGIEHALVQAKPCRFTRDNDKDDIAENTGKVYTGIIGLNCHNANNSAVSQQVGLWSAGCQVLNSPMQHAELMQLAEKAKDLYGNSFTYTLLEEDDLNG